MLDQNQKEQLVIAFQLGQSLQNISVSERLESIDSLAKEYLANFSILKLGLDFDGIKQFYEISGAARSDSEHLEWLIICLKAALLTQLFNESEDALRWEVPDDVSRYVAVHSTPESIKHYHANADKFLLEQMVQLAGQIGFQSSDKVTPREAIIQPYGFLYQVSHLPQHQEFHHGILNFALNWFDHLVQLEEYGDAANILNHICFALARRGQRKLAENLLVLIASKTKGLTNLVARTNLANLLREENQISLALRLYWQIIPGLLSQRAFLQLAQVLTHMAAIYRQKGALVKSVMTLEFSVLLNGWLKNRKSQAIARSQLASTYRYLRMYVPALNSANLAIEYFRKTNDYLNLGRSLLTRGNINYNLSRSEPAIDCFSEALQIGQQISDPQSTIGAISGKARVLIFLKRHDEAQSLLEEAINLRERNNDHNVGIEFENMGALFEQKGNFALALGWYQKALEQFEKYMPVEANNCRKKIAILETKLRAK